MGLSVDRLVWVACADKPINRQSLEMGLKGLWVYRFIGWSGWPAPINR